MKTPEAPVTPNRIMKMKPGFQCNPGIDANPTATETTTTEVTTEADTEVVGTPPQILSGRDHPTDANSEPACHTSAGIQPSVKTSAHR